MTAEEKRLKINEKNRRYYKKNKLVICQEKKIFRDNNKVIVSKRERCDPPFGNRQLRVFL